MIFYVRCSVTYLLVILVENANISFTCSQQNLVLGEFNALSDLKLVHLNACSVLPRIDSFVCDLLKIIYVSMVSKSWVREAISGSSPKQAHIQISPRSL